MHLSRYTSGFTTTSTPYPFLSLYYYYNNSREIHNLLQNRTQQSHRRR